jgi:hypothetical protein
MPSAHVLRSFRRSILVLLLSVLLAACSNASTVTSTAGSQKTASPSPSLAAQATLTSIPRPSPTTATPAAILVVPDTADPYQVSSLQAALKELAASSGMEFQQKAALSPEDIDSSVKVVVALQADPGLANLSKGAPNVQFAAVGIPGLQPGPNLSLIGPEGFRPDQQAFIAGYVAALLTFDWRVGVLGPGPVQGSSQLVQDAFNNGVRFFCGLCRPAHPPYQAYPQAFAIDAPGDEASWRAAADNLLQAAVTTVYVSPVSSSPALLAYLYQARVELIGGQAPTDDLRSQWIATILPDPASALTQLWPDLIAGKGGAQLPVPIVLADTSSGLLTEARLRLVNATLDDLVNGRIDPNPITEP